MRCPSCGEDNPEHARFCLACGTAFADVPSATGETRRVVTIVFADIAGSTAIGERLDPEALRRVQGRYFDAITAAVEAHGGTVEKYIGDAVMAVFGIPRLHEDDALRAVRAAAAMQGVLVALNEELERDHGVRIEIRVGVYTGEVVAGDPSAGQRLVTGDAVNVAARLEQAADAAAILLGETTYRLVKDAVRADPVAPFELKGKTGPVQAFALREVLTGLDGHIRNLDSPMVGREKELELFRRALERAVDERTSHLFTLLGPAGVGKSRLVREFLADVGGATVLQGRCLSYGEGITYYALGEILRAAAGIAEGSTSAESGERLRATLEGADDAARIALPLEGVLGAGAPAAPEDTQWAARKLFEQLAQERPLVVVIDDLHWAEPLLLDLVEHLADWTRDAALLLVVVARPELLEIRPAWGGGKLNATSILLEPLAGDEAGTLLDNLLGASELPAAARDRILAAAEGNPLFVEEMVGMLIDDGLLRFEEGTWVAAADLADLTVPPTIQLLLAARLDRLDAEERAVMERGAVEGKVFHSGAVTSLAPERLRPHVRPRLLALARKELIRPDRAEFAGEDAFRFRHLLIRDAAYQAMPKEQRADLHERFADWLEEAAGERSGEYVEIVAHHVEQAWRYRRELGVAGDAQQTLGGRASRALRRSAEHAIVRGDMTTAIHLLERASELASGSDALLAQLELGEALEMQGRYAEALEVVEAIVDGAPVDLAISIRARILVAKARGQTDPGWTIASGQAALRAIRDEALALQREDLVDRCDMVLGGLAFFAGRAGEQRAVALRLLPKADRMRPSDRRDLTFGLAAAVAFGPVPVDEGFATAQLIDDLWGGAFIGRMRAHAIRGSLYAMRGDADAFDEATAAADALVAEMGDGREWKDQPQVESQWRLGRHDLAEEWGRRKKAENDQEGETGSNSTLTALLAYYACERERWEEAADLVEDARRMAAADDLGALVPIGWVDALLASERGDHETAIATIDRAWATIAPTDYLPFQADTQRVRGKVLAAAGHPDEAEGAFNEALELYARKGNVASAASLRAEIGR